MVHCRNVLNTNQVVIRRGVSKRSIYYDQRWGRKTKRRNMCVCVCVFVNWNVFFFFFLRLVASSGLYYFHMFLSFFYEVIAINSPTCFARRGINTIQIPTVHQIPISLSLSHTHAHTLFRSPLYISHFGQAANFLAENRGGIAVFTTK